MNFKKFINDVRNAVLSNAEATEVILPFKNASGTVISLVECFDPRSRLPLAVIKYRDRVRLVNVSFSNENHVNLNDDSKRSDLLCALKTLLQRHDERSSVYCLSAKGIAVNSCTGSTRCIVGGKNVITYTARDVHNTLDLPEDAVIVQGGDVNFVITSDLDIDHISASAVANRLLPLVAHLDKGYVPPVHATRHPAYAS